MADEGLLMSWTLSKQPSFTPTVSPCKLQRQVRTSETDTTNMICSPHADADRLYHVHQQLWNCSELKNQRDWEYAQKGNSHYSNYLWDWLDKSQSTPHVLDVSHFLPHYTPRESWRKCRCKYGCINVLFILFFLLKTAKKLGKKKVFQTALGITTAW